MSVLFSFFEVFCVAGLLWLCWLTWVLQIAQTRIKVPGRVGFPLWPCKAVPPSKKRLPPGTLGWPLIGESLEFMASYRSDEPDRFLNRRILRYGHVFTTHLFGKPTIISSDPELNRFILMNEGKLFCPDYPKSLNDLWGKWAILRLGGSLHKKIHGLIGSFLKSSELKRDLTIVVENYARSQMSTWDGRLILLEDEAKKVGFNATVKVLLSLNPGSETQLLRKEFHNYISGIISLPIRIPGTTFSRSLQAKKEIVMVVKSIINDRHCSPSKDYGKDLLGILLAHKDENGESFPVELITDNIISFLFPSEDSVAMLITLAVKFLSDCPEALHQMREENLTLKRRTQESLSWKDYMDLQFTQNVLDETLRLGNIVKGVIRRALADVEVKDYCIPKGWAVFPFFRGVHLNSQFYSDPHLFNPWRWQVKVPSINFTPFGGGPRYCAGIEIARLEAIIFLHHLVTGFRWTAEDDIIINFPFVKLAKNLPLNMQRTPIT
eukprot:c6641_g1_i1 orf=89-1567(-)